MTTKTQSDLETLINTTISNYNTDNLQDFNRPFRHSQLTGLIDDTDDSILSNVTTVTLEVCTPDTTKTAYTLSFDNAFFHHDGHNLRVVLLRQQVFYRWKYNSISLMMMVMEILEFIICCWCENIF